MATDNRYRLRQLALVAARLAPVEQALTGIFGIRVAHRDLGVRKFGLENIVVPVGDQFIEVVAPIEDGTTAERYLQRRSGDGGYMVILQCSDPKGRDERVRALGMRKVHGIDRDDYDGLQIHPRDTGGSFLEIDWTVGFDETDSAWYPAGDDWAVAKCTDVVTGIAAAIVQSPAPQDLAARWGAILGHEVSSFDGTLTIALAQGELRFVPLADDRGEGLSEIDLVVADRGHIDREAAARGIPVTGDQLSIGGVRFNLLSA